MHNSWSRPEKTLFRNSRRTIARPNGRNETWHYPSRAECMVCHSRAAGFVLGLNTLQMNRAHDLRLLPEKSDSGIGTSRNAWLRQTAPRPRFRNRSPSTPRLVDPEDGITTRPPGPFLPARQLRLPSSTQEEAMRRSICTSRTAPARSKLVGAAFLSIQSFWDSRCGAQSRR